jgi:hypothetical protein
MQVGNRNTKRRTFALVILLFGNFMDILGTMVINIARAGASLNNWQLLPVLLITGAGWACWHRLLLI